MDLGFVKKESVNQKIATAEIKLAGFFSEHNISFKTADHLIEIIKENFTDPETVKNVTLKRTKCRAIVENVIGETFKEELVKILKETKFSILIDESTDIACTKSMCIVTRFFDSSSGRVVSKFFELINVFGPDLPENIEQGATAENLYTVLMDAFNKYGIPKENVVGFGSDGCNTMIGQNNSIASRLRQDFPGIVILKCIHCISARVKHVRNFPVNWKILSEESLTLFMVAQKGWLCLRLFKNFLILMFIKYYILHRHDGCRCWQQLTELLSNGMH